ncbi:MAG: flagellar brake protein [Halanaerobiales bacterium]
MIKELQVNKRIDILVEDGPYQGSYLSKVAEVNEDNFKVTSPFNKGEIVPLRTGQQVQVFCTGNSAAYTFFAKIQERQSRPIALLTLQRTSDIIRIQRREYFRIEVKRDVKYRIIDTQAVNMEEDEKKFYKTQTIDISAGGVKLVADDRMPADGMIELYLDIPGLEKVALVGEIVNNYNLPDGRAVGIEFRNINQNQQDIIIGWLFDYQRELRKKGLL